MAKRCLLALVLLLTGAADAAQDVQEQLKLGWRFFDGDADKGIKPDREAAFEHFRKAAHGGDVPAQSLLGNLLCEHARRYEFGAGVPKDAAKAKALSAEGRDWYLKAADQGDVEAMGGLVRVYADQGDRKLARYWASQWARAARKKTDIRRMALSLADIEQGALGGKPDAAQAYRWLLIAAAYGEHDHPERLESLRAGLSLAQISRAEESARNWKPGQSVALAERPVEPRPPAAPKPAAPAMEAAEQSAALPPPLSPGFALKENPDDFALVIGIEDYKSAPRAKFAERDASAVRNYLRGMGYPERNTVTLAGSDATLSGLLSYLEEWLPKNVRPSSRLFVFFSGHGAPEPKSAEAYLVPWDGKLAYLKSTALPLSRFFKDLQGLKAKSVVVALDACFSGSGARSAIMEGARPLVAVRSVSEEPPPNMAVLASSASGEISVMHESAGHGLFTYHLLKALDAPLSRGLPVTAGEAFDALAVKVSDGARRLNGEQTPQFRGDREAALR